MVMLYKWY